MAKLDYFSQEGRDRPVLRKSRSGWIIATVAADLSAVPWGLLEYAATHATKPGAGLPYIMLAVLFSGLTGLLVLVWFRGVVKSHWVGGGWIVGLAMVSTIFLWGDWVLFA